MNVRIKVEYKDKTYISTPITDMNFDEISETIDAGTEKGFDKLYFNTEEGRIYFSGEVLKQSIITILNK